MKMKIDDDIHESGSIATNLGFQFGSNKYKFFYFSYILKIILNVFKKKLNS